LPAAIGEKLIPSDAVIEDIETMRSPYCMTLYFALALFLALSPNSANARSEAVSIDLKGGKARVTFLDGTASVVKKGVVKAQPLAKDDMLSGGDRVTTGKKSRIELQMPDGSFLRFDEETTFALQSVTFEKQQKRRKITISMILGKTWAKVSRLLGIKGRFEIATRTAVAGVRGTVYRVNVDRDNSVTVKVYWGEVVVNSARRTAAGERPAPITQPTKVEGPKPISGPHPVTMEEWTYIVKALHQINIRPDGTVTKPFRFSIEDDLNEWVVWNQQRDKELGDNWQ
jgi:hypothetical protein